MTTDIGSTLSEGLARLGRGYGRAALYTYSGPTGIGTSRSSNLTISTGTPGYTYYGRPKLPLDDLGPTAVKVVETVIGYVKTGIKEVKAKNLRDKAAYEAGALAPDTYRPSAGSASGQSSGVRQELLETGARPAITVEWRDPADVGAGGLTYRVSIDGGRTWSAPTDRTSYTFGGGAGGSDRPAPSQPALVCVEARDRLGQTSRACQQIASMPDAAEELNTRSAIGSGSIELHLNDSLLSGTPFDRLRSPNGGRYMLVMQTDGNLVLYDGKEKAVWSSGTSDWGRSKKSGAQFRLRVDGFSGDVEIESPSDGDRRLVAAGGRYGQPRPYALVVEPTGRVALIEIDGYGGGVPKRLWQSKQ